VRARLYAEAIAAKLGILWKNGDLRAYERKFVPDLNPEGIGTQFGLDLRFVNGSGSGYQDNRKR
jgi:hypothetical protein